MIFPSLYVLFSLVVLAIPAVAAGPIRYREGTIGQRDIDSFNIEARVPDLLRQTTVESRDIVREPLTERDLLESRMFRAGGAGWERVRLMHNLKQTMKNNGGDVMKPMIDHAKHTYDSHNQPDHSKSGLPMHWKGVTQLIRLQQQRAKLPQGQRNVQMAHALVQKQNDRWGH
ncbi:hypothetical protein GALMADRAFT_222704 [Galerina marginata CBS 339.88]|uniref:RxLR effector protein n=1 Tax=Galerina marginata (strain CBS 339.88) TaxID=685588 RepID=A0A067TMM8_GALM3|nr:hypothetical protein GALMADRAFT_222704 [Galerina marginata CBS 339.88]